jgi:hypothetical protein
MTAARAKAPTLAWLLTALSCLLAGMAIVESRHQAVALPHPGETRAPVGAVGTVGGDHLPTGTAEPTPTPIGDPRRQAAPLGTPRVGGIPLPLATGPVVLRVARLVVSSGGALPPEEASGWTVLMVEAGSLSVRVDGAALAGWGLDPSQFDAPLSAGGRLVIVPGARYAVRNDGVTPAVALVVAIEPVETMPDHGRLLPVG